MGVKISLFLITVGILGIGYRLLQEYPLHGLGPPLGSSIDIKTILLYLEREREVYTGERTGFCQNRHKHLYRPFTA